MSVNALFEVGFLSRDCWDRIVVFISRFGLQLGSKEEVLRGCGILSCFLVDGGIAETVARVCTAAPASQ